ncbi:type VII secretion target [Gordonia sp. DT30]|uniref:type VII secretion target n=1 Tax=unclassified Gordonia (in: high G+C Gram-positive bacteria) TaxID=2657482 RepID=UPI003CF0C6F2
MSGPGTDLPEWNRTAWNRSAPRRVQPFMTEQLSVIPAAVASFAADETRTASRVRAHATTTDVTPLALTFGLIGADFLTALGRVLDDRRARLSAVADRHALMAAQGTDAATSYAGTDDASARMLGNAAITGAGVRA